MRPPVGSLSASGPARLSSARRRRRDGGVEAIDARLLLGRRAPSARAGSSRARAARTRAAPTRALVSCDSRSRLLLEEARVAAVVGVELAAVELEDARGDAVEEVAIVRDQEQRARPLRASRSSSHATVSASRWLVGSSSASSAGRANSARASATRRRSPPDKVPIFDLERGSCRAAASERTSCSRSQPPAASMRGVQAAPARRAPRAACRPRAARFSTRESITPPAPPRAPAAPGARSRRRSPRPRAAAPAARTRASARAAA